MRLQESGADPAIVRLSVFNDSNNTPDFTKQLAEKTLTFGSPDPTGEVTFTFDNPTSVAMQHRYWLMLDIAGYQYDNRNFFWNSWQNAVASGDPYPDGFYGMGTGRGIHGSCDGICSFSASDTGADWYMKIELE